MFTNINVPNRRQIQNYTQKLAKDTSAIIMEMMKLPVEQPTQRIARERLSDEYMATLNAFQVQYYEFLNVSRLFVLLESNSKNS